MKSLVISIALTLLNPLACLAGAPGAAVEARLNRVVMDVYITSVGIVICQCGDPPFPNGKGEKGEVWGTIYQAPRKAQAQPKPRAKP